MITKASATSHQPTKRYRSARSGERARRGLLRPVPDRELHDEQRDAHDGHGDEVRDAETRRRRRCRACTGTPRGCPVRRPTRSPPAQRPRVSSRSRALLPESCFFIDYRLVKRLPGAPSPRTPGHDTGIPSPQSTHRRPLPPVGTVRGGPRPGRFLPHPDPTSSRPPPSPPPPPTRPLFPHLPPPALRSPGCG